MSYQVRKGESWKWMLTVAHYPIVRTWKVILRHLGFNLTCIYRYWMYKPFGSTALNIHVLQQSNSTSRKPIIRKWSEWKKLFTYIIFRSKIVARIQRFHIRKARHIYFDITIWRYILEPLRYLRVKYCMEKIAKLEIKFSSY